MNRKTAWSVTLAAGTLLAMTGLVAPCAAQSLFGLRIGEPSTTLSRLGPAADTCNYKEMVIKRWDLPDGNGLSVTLGVDSKIAYLELDWGGKSDDPGIDLQGLHFGATSLNDLRKRFKSNGFEYQDRGSVADTQDGVVMLNSYEVGGAVITFYTKVSASEFSRAKASGANPSPADYAKLDAISIADDRYAKSEWGDRAYDPAYKNPDWK